VQRPWESYRGGVSTEEPDYLTVNRANWDERAPIHVQAPARLPGLEGIHLQCHIGTDTISLVRLGAG